MTATQRARPPRLFSIPPGARFLETLADALLDGTLVPGFSRADAPLGLARATIYVPSRRSARALAAVIAGRLATPSALLPRIVPLGTLDGTELLFDPGGLSAEGGLGDDADPGLPTAIGDIARRMILTRLVLAWGQAVRHAVVSVDEAGRRSHDADEPLLVATSPADAWHLSGDLARLIDDLIIEDVPPTALKDLGTESFDRYWRITLDFLDVAVAHYPQILAGLSVVDRATRQVRLIEAETARLAADRTAGPVIVAGSTGSNRATARLIAAVSRLAQGAVVLPGLDLGLDQDAWATLAGGEAGDGLAGHPQHALRLLLAAIGTDRAGVVEIGAVPDARRTRGRLVSEALRPADTTDRWRALDLDRAEALAGVTLVEAADEREEALAIAVALREALEGNGTAALVTPDRTLARRVGEELARWSIEAEDSSGTPLGQTQAGTLARLALECARQDLSPVEALALLHHPDVRLGRARADLLAVVRRLESDALRGVLPARALHHPSALPRLAGDGSGRELATVLGELAEAMGALRSCEPTAPLPAWVAAHEAALVTLVTDEEGGTAAQGTGYPVLSALFEELEDAADAAIVLDCAGYAALFDRLAADMPVRGPARPHPRVKILGLLEARLLTTDRVVLGGLDEGIWPPEVRTDPFLNRPMRQQLGLSAPERRIGQTAHDFEMALGQDDVLITRSLKRGGSPTVPSRFLQRLAALAGAEWPRCVERGARYLDLARRLDRPAAVCAVPRPAPRPPVRLRPTSLSVTRVEALRRDPYAIYAERILKLVPREPLAAQVGARELGTAFHAALAAHARDASVAASRADASGAMRRHLEDLLAGPLRDADFRAFHWPRVERWIGAYVGWDAARRADLAATLIEHKGSLDLRLADGSVFQLRAEADRIEVDGRGDLTIVDFKTGSPPSLREVKAGFAPQLTLEAAMAAEGAFSIAAAGGEAPAPARVTGAVYVKFGNADEVTALALDWRGDPAFEDVVAAHRDELVALLNSFRREETGYLARPFPKYASRFAPYDALSRVKEWSASGGDGGAEA